MIETIRYHVYMRTSKQKTQILAIVGQTASGKSALAIKLATLFNGEIISADSRQVYKGMDIGSGKISRKERKIVPHHLLDVASPKRDYTVAHFVRDAQKTIKKISTKHKLPIICGGTGFWIDTLLFDLPLAQVAPHPNFRKKLSHLSAEQLLKKLLKLNPKRAKIIDQKNPVRLIRAIEIETFGTLPSYPNKKHSPYNIIWVGLLPPKNKLKKLIRARLQKRLRSGLIFEVQKLHRSGISWKRLEKFGLEYRHVSRYLQHAVPKKQMQEDLEKDIFKYAKRQMTWFKKNSNINWFASQKAALTFYRKIYKKSF